MSNQRIIQEMIKEIRRCHTHQLKQAKTTYTGTLEQYTLRESNINIKIAQYNASLKCIAE